MSQYVNNTREMYYKALLALEALGRGLPTAYHLERVDYSGNTIPARPDMQSEEEYNTILSRIADLNRAMNVIRAELAERLKPLTPDM